MNHRFLDKIEDRIKKGSNQLFLYGNLEDYFLFDVYVGIRNLRDNLFFYFVKSDFDYFIEVNGDRIVAFDKDNRELSLDDAFNVDKRIEGFAKNLTSDDFEKIRNNKAKLDTSSIESKVESQATFNARDKILKNFDKYKLFIFIPDLEYQANLYKDENIEFIRFIRDLKFSKNSISIITIKNLERLNKFDFEVDEKSKEAIFIGNPSIEELKTFFIREAFKNDREIDYFSIDELAQAFQASKKTLREAIKIIKNNNKKISLNNFEKFLDKTISEKVTFKDVVLKDKEKIINSVKTFLEDRENSQKGLILYGPPGTGKTFIAKAIANEFNMYFLAPTLADLKGEYVGESGRKIKKIFEEARANAPSILFLDEMDTIFKKRGEGDSYVEDMVNQFLVEIDGVKSFDDRIFIIGATNRLETVDEAIKSRLFPHIKISLPDRNERETIISKQFKKFKFSRAEFKNEILDKTEGMSGRDLYSLCKDIKKMSENENIKKSHFDTAIKNFENNLVYEFESKLEGSLKIEEPQIKFDDVVGYKEIKESLKDEVEYILMDEEDKKLQKEFGIKQNRGTLLYGPPGNGKTTFAEALAGSYGFYYIRIVSRDFISSYLEETLKKLETIFEYSVKLSKITNKKGVVLFFDEIDSLIGKENLNPIIRGTLLKFLEDKKGIKAENSKIVLIAATNYFEKLDEASIREGRFDNKFEVRYPNEEEIKHILFSFLKIDKTIENRLNEEYIKKLIDYLKFKKSLENREIAIVDVKNLKERLKRFAFKIRSIQDKKIFIDSDVVNKFLKKIKE
jgi:transitional endoplasmic reticulum ATPase